MDCCSVELVGGVVGRPNVGLVVVVGDVAAVVVVVGIVFGVAVRVFAGVVVRVGVVGGVIVVGTVDVEVGVPSGKDKEIKQRLNFVKIK